jgi:hypothetical protein
MGQTCCGGQTEIHELSSKTKPAGELTHLEESDHLRMLRAVVKAQAAYRGLITRRIIRDETGFVAKPGICNRVQKGNIQYTHSSHITDQSEARKLVMKIRNSLEPFEWEPTPAPDRIKRVKRPL